MKKNKYIYILTLMILLAILIWIELSVGLFGIRFAETKNIFYIF